MNTAYFSIFNVIFLICEKQLKGGNLSWQKGAV